MTKKLEKRIRTLELLLLDLATRKDRCMYIYQIDLIEALAKRKIFSEKKIQNERAKKRSKWYKPPVGCKSVKIKFPMKGAKSFWATSNKTSKSLKKRKGKAHKVCDKLSRMPSKKRYREKNLEKLKKYQREWRRTKPKEAKKK